MMMKNYNIFTCVHIAILHGSPMRINIYLKIKMNYKDNNKISLRVKIKHALREAKFSIKYILGKILWWKMLVFM